MDNSKLNNILQEYASQKDACTICALKIRELLIELLNAESLKFHSVNDRIKKEESLIKKFNLKNAKYNKLEDMTDIIGIRIITYYSDDIDRVAQLIEENFDVDQKNSIDKREMLDIDRFGYLSLHYVVKLKKERLKLPEYRYCKKYKIEIQIRSILQHAWAEIEHDLGYKNNIETPREIRRNFFRLAGLLETADKEFIDIRNEISDYERTIQKRIVDKEELIFIDKISLEAYANNDLKYKELITKISKKINVNFYKKSNLYSTNVQFLLYMNYETINQIKEDIIKNEKKICEVAKAILQNNIRDVPESAILLYLCYVKLAEKDSIEEFGKFFNEFDFTNKTDMEEFATRIIEACKKVN